MLPNGKALDSTSASTKTVQINSSQTSSLTVDEGNDFLTEESSGKMHDNEAEEDVEDEDKSGSESGSSMDDSSTFLEDSDDEMEARIEAARVRTS